MAFIGKRAMPAEVKDWLTALRSGKFQQATGCLMDADGGMCCLGLGTFILDEENWALINKPGSDNQKIYAYKRCYTGMPPAIFFKTYGISSDFGHRLADANDSGASFHDIADMIERYFYGYID